MRLKIAMEDGIRCGYVRIERSIIELTAWLSFSLISMPAFSRSNHEGNPSHMSKRFPLNDSTVQANSETRSPAPGGSGTASHHTPRNTLIAAGTLDLYGEISSTL